MNIVEFFKTKNLGNTADRKESEKTYQGSDIAVQYLRLDKSIKNTGQNYLVLSKGAAKALNEGTIDIKEVEVTLSEVNGKQVYGCIRPDSGRLIKKETLF